MPIYHLTAKIISRSAGRSATASAAYRSAEKIKDDRQNMTFNYTARTQSVNHSEILTPENAPAFCKDRSKLWNAVEASETRKDSQVAREIEVALPKELTPAQNIELAREFAKTAFVARGMIADVCIHDAKKNNPHAHIMLTTRHVNAQGFGQKNREWNKSELVETWRKEWEQICNKHLEKYGFKDRIDSRTLEAQNIDRKPQKHLGVTALSFEKRTHQESEKRKLIIASGFLTAKRRLLSLFSKQEKETFIQNNEPEKPTDHKLKSLFSISEKQALKVKEKSKDIELE